MNLSPPGKKVLSETTAFTDGFSKVLKKAEALLLLNRKSRPAGVKYLSDVLLKFANTRRSSGATSLRLSMV
jgi:hypothetical protein